MKFIKYFVQVPLLTKPLAPLPIASPIKISSQGITRISGSSKISWIVKDSCFPIKSGITIACLRAILRFNLFKKQKINYNSIINIKEKFTYMILQLKM